MGVSAHIRRGGRLQRRGHELPFLAIRLLEATGLAPSSLHEGAQLKRQFGWPVPAGAMTAGRAQTPNRVWKLAQRRVSFGNAIRIGIRLYSGS